MIGEVNCIVRRPVGDERNTIGIRTAYAAQAGGYDTSLVMLEDGVYSLIGQIPDYLKNMIGMFLESEGRLACFAECLASRGIKKEDFIFPETEILDREAIAELIADSDSVNLF